MNRSIWILSLIAALAIGIAIGWALDTERDTAEPLQPADWIARVGDQYITQAEFEDEMARRAGSRPGQFHELSQRQALLDELVFRRALVARAESAGTSSQPAVRRSLDQILINHLLQTELRPRQESAEIDPEAIEAFFQAHADEYAIPARRRVAMLQFNVASGAGEQARIEAYEQAGQARDLALELDASTRDFGVLARDFSEHQASRYRGGVIGWVSEGDPARYSHPAVVVDTANTMTEPGQVSSVLENGEGLYVVRLVDYEPRRTRSLDELRDGITQRLLRDQFNRVEDEFRRETLAGAELVVRPGALEQVTPPGPPARPARVPEPPPVPGLDEQGD